MNIKELKTAIQNNNLNDSLLVFKNLDDNNWLVNQYINEISKIRNKQIIYIDSIDNLINTYSSIVDNYLYVVKVDSLEKEYNYKNTIIITKKINKELNYIEFPKLEIWQIKDYLTTYIKGLNNNDLDYIFNLTNNDIYLLDNEIKKLSLFRPVDQPLIFNLLKEEYNYKEGNNSTLFNLTNKIIKKDINGIKEILNYKYTIDPIALNSILIKQFKNIIKVQMRAKSANYENLGMDYKQFKAIEYNCNKYSNKQLVNIYEFLTDIDYKLKSGSLELSSNDLFNYILYNVVCV